MAIVFKVSLDSNGGTDSAWTSLASSWTSHASGPTSPRYRVVPAGAAAVASRTGLSLTNSCMAVDINFHALPTGGPVKIMAPQDSGGNSCGEVSFDTSGKVRLVDSAGTLRATSTTVLTLDHDYRIERKTDGSTTCSVSIYEVQSSTAIETISYTGSAGVFKGTATARFGPTGASPTIDTFYIDNIRISDQNANIGPASTSSGANAGPDQASIEPGQLVTLDGSGSQGASTYSWAQTGGTTVTLSSTTAQKPTFTAPYLLATETLTFQLTINGGSQDSVAIEVLFVIERKIQGGNQVPILEIQKASST